VAVHELAPGGDRQSVTRLAIPWDLRDPQAALAPREDGTAEEKQERDLAALQRVEVLRRGDVEVVRARHREIDLAGAREPGSHRGDVRPEERLQRIAPALGHPEQLLEARPLVGGVAPTLRLDPDLAAQRERVNG